MFETLTSRGKKGLDELGVAKLAEETKSVSANVLVGVLQVHADTVTARSQQPLKFFQRARTVSLPNQNHLLLQLAGSVMLGADLVVHV